MSEQERRYYIGNKRYNKRDFMFAKQLSCNATGRNSSCKVCKVNPVVEVIVDIIVGSVFSRFTM